MNIYFSNKTTVRSENNMSDLDIMQANNELGREKKKLRYTVTIAIAIPVFIIIYFFLIPRLFHNVGMRIVIAAISMVIGYFPAEAVVRAKYGSGAGTGAVVTPPKTFTYNFTEDKITYMTAVTEKMSLLLQAYFGLTPEEIAKIPETSAARLTIMLEEGYHENHESK